jgi:PIN like domain
VDESALGLGKLLASTRDDVIYAGHPHLLEVPLGTIDIGWMPIVAERNGVAIRRDCRIHTRPLEVRVFSEVGLRTVWLGGKKDMGSHQQLDLVIRHWQALEDRRRELGPGPWSVTLLGGGLSPRVWRPQD